MPGPRVQITWAAAGGPITALEPTPDEVAQHAAVLAAAYNDPYNAPLLGHTQRIDPADVIAHYAAIAREGGHNFLVFRGAELIGDADLRGVARGAAEFAFLVAAPAAHGKGLGTRMAIMVHAFGFRRCRLERIYASIVPGNAASSRVFDKLGYAVDDSPAARAYADDEGDITMSIERARFERGHATQLAEILIARR